MDNFNTQIKKNAISFDIDFENIKQNTLTTKQDAKQPKKVEIIPNVEDPNDVNKEQTLYKCPNCERTFKREAYAKHVPVCARVFNNKNQENNKNMKEKEKEKKIEKKGFNKKSKWENQSDELRAIIQSKRAEKADDHKKKELKIEIEEDKRHTSNNIALTQSNKKEGYTRDGIYYQCDLCGKKFTKMNYENHLNDCKQKHKEKKNITFVSKPNIGMMNNNPSSPSTRQPTLPAVTYGGYSKKPNFNLKFGKH